MKELFENYKAENGRYPSIHFDNEKQCYCFFKKHVQPPKEGLPPEYLKHLRDDQVDLTHAQFHDLNKEYKLRQTKFSIMIIQSFEVE